MSGLPGGPAEAISREGTVERRARRAEGPARAGPPTRRKGTPVPAVSVPRRPVAAAALALLLVAALASLPRTKTGDAQDAGADRVAALETRVAALDRRVRDLERAGATPALGPAEGAAASGAAGTLGDPVPLGQEAEVGPGWTMRVVDLVVDGADELITPTLFTDPPAEGYQSVVVAVALTNRTGEARRASSVVGLSTAGRSGLSYRAFAERCGHLPDELPRMEVPPGRTVDGTLCFSVRTGDVGSLVLYTDPSLTFDRADRVYFALA
jgi:hypothetical protein